MVLEGFSNLNGSMKSVNYFVFLILEHLLENSNLANLYQERKLSSWHSLACTTAKLFCSPKTT